MPENRSVFWRVLLFTVILAAAPFQTKAGEDVSPKTPVMRLAVQPCWSPKITYTLFSPLANFLSKETGLRVTLLIADNELHFHRLIPKADLVLQDSYSAYFHQRRGFTLEPVVVAVGEDGEPTERGAIIVRVDSPIESLQDLQGKTFIFGAPHNTRKFFATYITLKRHGIDPLKDLSGFALGNECSYNAMSVFLGEFDAGAVCADFLEESERFAFIKNLRVLAYTDPMPNWMITLKGDLTPKLRDKVTRALLLLKPGTARAERALFETGWKGFVPVKGDELSRIERLQESFSVPTWEELEKNNKIIRILEQ